MATALFQCVDQPTAAQMQVLILSEPPCDDVKTWLFGKLFGISFRYDCVQIYHWGMNLVTRFQGRVAFIGIDERASVPDDKYKLMILDNMPAMPSLRNQTERSYFASLKRDFLKAIKKYEYSYEEIHAICQACYLGVDQHDAVNYIARVIYHISNSNIRMINTNNLLDGPVTNNYSDGSHRTMIRCMAHFCYLGLS